MSAFSSLAPARPWLKVGGQLAECPTWDAERETLFWTDIPTRRLYAQRWGSNEAPALFFESEQQIGGFTLQRDGRLLLFRERDIALLEADGSALRVVAPFEHAGSTRFNDVTADPQGRVFAGTIGKSGDSGALFRVDLDGSLSCVATGTGISNGITFSPGYDFLYWVCSTRRTIFRFPYNAATGQLGEPTPFFVGTPADGYPDGLTSDTEGNLYSIRWAAKEEGLYIFNPEGEVIHRQKLPAVATSSAAFCGPQLRDLAITSAADESDPDRPADLFRIEGMPISGRPDPRSSLFL